MASAAGQRNAASVTYKSRPAAAVSHKMSDEDGPSGNDFSSFGGGDGGEIRKDDSDGEFGGRSDHEREDDGGRGGGGGGGGSSDDDDEAQDDSVPPAFKGPFTKFCYKEYDNFNPASLTKKAVVESQEKARMLQKAKFEAYELWGYADENGNYCYMCESEKTTSNLGGQNVPRMKIEQIMREDIDQKDPYYTALQIHDLHLLDIAPWTGKAWSMKSIHDHIYKHRIDAKSIHSQHIRNDGVIIENLMRYMKQDGRPADPKLVDTLLKTQKAQAASVSSLLRLTAKK